MPGGFKVPPGWKCQRTPNGVQCFGNGKVAAARSIRSSSRIVTFALIGCPPRASDARASERGIVRLQCCMLAFEIADAQLRSLEIVAIRFAHAINVITSAGGASWRTRCNRLAP